MEDRINPKVSGKEKNYSILLVGGEREKEVSGTLRRFQRALNDSGREHYKG